MTDELQTTDGKCPTCHRPLKAAGSGGAKGAAILAAFQSGPLTRKEAAERAGCTVGRVGEVLRD